MGNSNAQPAAHKTGSQNSPRDAMLDMQKGYAILLVLIGHIIQFSTPNFDDNTAFRLIYSFHMPLFFLISGIAAELAEGRGIPKKLAPFLRIKSDQLIAPFFAWAFISLVFEMTREYISPLEYFKALIHSVDNGLWFLFALFWCHFFSKISATSLDLLKPSAAWSGICRMIAEAVLACAIAICLALLAKLTTGSVNFLGLGFFLKYFPFFALGRLWQKMGRPMPKNLLIKIGCLLAFLALFPFYHRVNGPAGIILAFEWAPPSIVSISFYYLIGTTGSLTFLIITQAVNSKLPSRIKSPITHVGRRSLDIYAIQVYFFPLFSSLAGIALAPIGIFIVSSVIRMSHTATKLLLGGK